MTSKNMMGEEPEKNETRFDWEREQRTGLPEIVLGSGKSIEQLAHILSAAAAKSQGILLSRLDGKKYEVLSEQYGLDYDAVSCTAFFGQSGYTAQSASVAIVCAGTSDIPVAHEALRSLYWFGYKAKFFCDVGVAGLWRILEIQEELQSHRVVIAVAGMEGALFSVIGGLVPGLVIALPTSVGYGVAKGGRAALSSALASCTPGVVALNIDNGVGAAAAACKVLRGESSFRK